MTEPESSGGLLGSSTVDTIAVWYYRDVPHDVSHGELGLFKEYK